MKYEISLTKSAYSMILFVKVIMVGGSTKIPKIQELLKDFFGKEPSTNPDETVVTGATIQAAILSGQVDGITVLDVNSLTLGIEVNGGAFAPIIKRNTAIPTKKSQMYAVVYLLRRFHFLMTSRSVSQLLLTNKLL